MTVPSVAVPAEATKAFEVTQAASQVSDHQWTPCDVKKKPVADNPQL